MRALLRLAVSSGLVVALLAACGDVAPQAVQFESARIRLPVPGTDKAVGYFQITNHTDEIITLTGARSGQIRSIEMHTMTREGDMMRMRRLQAVEVQPDEMVEFVPGGRHLMLFGADGLGDRVDLVFTSAEGGEYRHTFTTFLPGDSP
jgi:copper(I)-binding protein